ncbi:DsbA family oxidoreductase [Microbacterium gorillae]|uniref:DsbA family oxidoreductase n=1 Tax=Microbacterium gorillae TaxID=1231063 RepID=UPI000B9A3EBF|nr:DsbA family oxidoreductase [Microbacterium gorillae]
MTDATATEPTTDSKRLKVDVWLDVACPFCLLGDKRLENVRKELPFGDDIDVVYHSYQLDPSAPEHAEPGSQEAMLLARGYDPAQLEASHRNLSEQAVAEGFRFDFDAVAPSNTYTAHRFIQAAASERVQQQVLDAIFAAYFTDGVDVGDTAALVELAVGAGLSRELAERVAADERTFDTEVRQDIAQAAAYGIQGVPFFVLDGRYGVSGAQPSDAFRQALTQVHTELNA